MPRKIPIQIESSLAEEDETSRIERDGASDKASSEAALSTSEPAPQPAAPGNGSDRGREGSEDDLSAWRDRALRLQADMDNFRKRQRRLAEERVLGERERMLRAFLGVLDDLSRALRSKGDLESLRQGVQMTHRAVERLLDQEGVTAIEAEGQVFDPKWHEALSTVPYREVMAEPGTIVEVVQDGYRLGDRLLRPARVVVAA